jgi:NAD(P)H-nitrite reductase large subunit
MMEEGSDDHSNIPPFQYSNPRCLMELDDELCLCFHVTKRKVLNYLRVQRPRAVSQLSECYGAGTGCGWCRAYLRHLFEQIVQQSESAEPEPTAEQYAARRSEYVRAGGGTPPPGATPID